MKRRAIKFRVWNNKTKSWVHGPKQEPHLFGETILLGGFMQGVPLLDLDDCVPLQFTGMLDKNGVEIYEGDILLCRDDFADDQHEARFKVIWDDDRWAFQMEGDEDGGHYWYEVNLDCQIIGNIYENPELL